MGVFSPVNFFCCLPLRHGVFVLSLAAIMLSGTGAAGSWIIVMMLDRHPQEIQDQIALFVQAIMLSLLGVLALIGFTAGIVESRGLLFIYGKIVAGYVVLDMGTLGLLLYSALRPVDNSLILNCQGGETDDELVKQFCGKGFNFVKGLPIGFLIAGLLVEIYTFIIVKSWSSELEVDEAASFVSEDNPKGSGKRFFRTKYLNF